MRTDAYSELALAEAAGQQLEAAKRRRVTDEKGTADDAGSGRGNESAAMKSAPVDGAITEIIPRPTRPRARI